MRSARRFRKRVQLWQVVELADGFGGYTLENELITTTWADVQSISSKPYSNVLTDFGINASNLAVMITVRKRNDLTYNSINQYIVYAGEKYNILTYPEDKNFDHRTITFLAFKDALKSVDILEPLDMVESIYDAYEVRVVVDGATITGVNCQKNFINDLLDG